MTSAVTTAATLVRGRAGARDGVVARRLFWAGVVALVLFELAAIWFIMPLPGSQRIRSVRAAYFLHAYRWAFRGVALALLLAGAREGHYGVKDTADTILPPVEPVPPALPGA